MPKKSKKTDDADRKRAVADLKKLFNKCMKLGKVNAALKVRSQLNELLGLHDMGVDGSQHGAADGSSARLELIAAYILPLKLADEGCPVEEHVRIASEIIRTQRLEVQEAEGKREEAKCKDDARGAGHLPAAPD